MKIIKKFLYLNLIIAFCSLLSINQADFASTRLTPYHIYNWARSGNIDRLQQFQRYINLQDQDRNTALCIAQQHKDKHSYTLLLKFGASTKVSCHNDKDPICAVVAGEKLKVSPAGWLLLGAGAAAGAYALLDNDNGHKHKRCPVGYEKGRKDCSDKPNPSDWEYVSSGYVDEIPCGKCVLKVCPTGYSTDYQSASDCGTSGSNGWEYTVNGTVDDKNCGKCTPYQCTRYDDGKGVSDVTQCPKYSSLQEAIDTNAIGWAGDEPCYHCTYTCKNSAGYYDDEDDCLNAYEGYTCKSITENGITCWLKDVPSSCPTGYSTDYQSASDCGPSGSNGWEYTSQGTSGDLKCGKCTPYQCTRYDDGKGVSDVTQCPKYSSLQEAIDTNAIGWAGNEPCYHCTYTCKNSAGYYDDEDDCLNAHEGYTCKSITENGITCWLVDVPSSCPTGYSTDYQSQDDCSDTHPEGYTYTSSGTSGGQLCGKCTPKTCRADYPKADVSACGSKGSNGWSWTQDTVTPYAGETACGKCEAFQCSKYDDGKGVADVTECPKYSNLQEAVDTNAIGWAGEAPCYHCTYTCKNSAGYYDDEDDCLDANEGFTCKSVIDHGVNCWIKDEPSSCPTGYSTDYQSQDDCSDTHPEGYTYTSSGTSGDKACGKCTPKTCRADYPKADVSACGSKGSNGWSWTQDTVTPYAGETACGKCEAFQCSKYDDGKGVADVTECPKYSNLQEAVDTNAIGWAGEAPCYHCTYTCKNSAGYYDDEGDCLDANEGFTCKSVTDHGVNCWIKDEPSSCPTGYSTDYQSQDDCSDTHPEGYTYTSSGTSGDKACGKCTPKTCRSDYPKADVSACGSKGSNGWSWTQDTVTPYAGETACGKCEAFQCSKYDDGKGVETVGQCMAYASLKATISTTEIGWAGETACYHCNYSCDTDNNYYTTEQNCLDHNTGYTCTSVTENNVECWIKYDTANCPTGYSTDYQSQDDCSDTHPEGYTYTSSGTSGDKACGKCMPKTCRSDYPKADVSACGSKGSNGWSWTQDTVTPYAGETACGKCEAFQCSKYDDGKGVADVTECPKYSNLQEAVDTNAIGWAGEAPCYHCTYTCKNSAGYYDDEGDCLDANEGFTCKSVTDHGVNCWIKDVPSSCPTGYSTDYQSLDDCSDTHSEGYTYTSSGTSGGLACGKCTPKTCRSDYQKADVSACGSKGSAGWSWTQDTVTPYAGETACGKCEAFQCSKYDDGKGVENVGQCMAYASLKATISTTEIGWAGETACYHCNYSCDTDNNYYTTEQNCLDHNTGYTCTSITENSIECWIKDGSANCPTGYSTDYQDVSDCGSKGSNGWNYSSQGTSGTLKCGKCEPKQCPPTTTGQSVTKPGDCPAPTGYTVGVDTNAVGWSGESGCYACTYACNSSANYFDDEDDCEFVAEETCSPVTEYGTTCYVPDSHISSTQTTNNMTLINTTKLNLTSHGDEDIVGINTNIDFENTTNEETGTVGEINITHNSTGQAIGVLSREESTAYNRAGSSINIANNNGGKAFGIYAEQGSNVVNEGTIKITGITGTAAGIYGEGNNTITNAAGGVIDVSGTDAYGIYVKDGSGTYITNAGKIYAQGTNAHGIYVDENSANATVLNTGEIYLNGTSVGDAGISLNGGTLRNMNLLHFDGSADLNSMSARFFLEDGGIYEAQSLSGDLNLGVSNVLGSNQDTYINDGLQVENTDDLNVHSESAMFTASLRSGSGTSPASIVLTRRSFEDIAPNSSVTEYLENNYNAGNMTDMYDKIKAHDTLSAAAFESAQQLGYSIFPNFAEENYTTLRSLNRVITDDVLTPTDEDNRVVAGADYINYETDRKGLLSGYELDASSIYTYGDKRLDNQNRLGLGLSITKLKSDYDNDGDRDLNIFNLFIPYMHKFTDNLRWASILSVGYGNGEYDRGNNHESDISDIFYGWNNELRYTMDLNGYAELEPAIMLNALGYNENGYDEGHGPTDIKGKKTENLSVETGIGLYLKKKVDLQNYGKLGFKIGGAYYRELADQYDDLKLKHRDGTGWYKVDDYAHIYDRNRGLFEAAIDYEFKRLSLYAKYNQLIQRDDPKLFDLGLKYNF